jgi:uncharacterized Zn finger protein (UPF0148 family)
MTLEKYGVDETTENHEKLAAADCPICGRRLERHGTTILCPMHGSEPFEASRKPDEK